MQRYTVPGMLRFMQSSDVSDGTFAILAAWSRAEAAPGTDIATAMIAVRNLVFGLIHNELRSKLISLLTVQSVCNDRRIELVDGSVAHAVQGGLSEGVIFEGFVAESAARQVFWHPDPKFRPPWVAYAVSSGRNTKRRLNQ